MADQRNHCVYDLKLLVNASSWKDKFLLKGDGSHFENFSSFQIFGTGSNVLRINENFIPQLSAIFTWRDGKSGEFSNQTRKCYIQGPARWIQRYKPSFLTNQNAQFLYSPHGNYTYDNISLILQWIFHRPDGKISKMI